MDDKIKIKCTHCSRMFRERAQKIRDGFQTNCPCCNRAVTFDAASDDVNIQRAFRSARDVRTTQELTLKRKLAEQSWAADRRQS